MKEIGSLLSAETISLVTNTNREESLKPEVRYISKSTKMS